LGAQAEEVQLLPVQAREAREAREAQDQLLILDILEVQVHLIWEEAEDLLRELQRREQILLQILEARHLVEEAMEVLLEFREVVGLDMRAQIQAEAAEVVDIESFFQAILVIEGVLGPMVWF
jgi:hypothetical protein